MSTLKAFLDDYENRMTALEQDPQWLEIGRMVAELTGVGLLESAKSDDPLGMFRGLLRLMLCCAAIGYLKSSGVAEARRLFDFSQTGDDAP